MATFMYEAADNQGNEVKAEIEAVNERDAREKIRALNYYPTHVAEKARDTAATPKAADRRRRGFSMSFSVSQKSLTETTRQFATLLDAGLPIVRSLDILWAQQSPGLLKDTLADVKADVEGGSALSEAMAKHPRIFDKLYVNMVKAGEAGGVLDQILSRLADYLEKSLRLKQKIIGALVYPAAVVIIAGGILTFILVFIIPKFEQMFKEMDMGGMPWLTELLMSISRMFASYWYVLGFLVMLMWAVFHFVGKTPKGRYTIDLMKLKLPIFGRIISKSSISRFCRTLGTLIQSGVPILNALSIIKNATGNSVVAGAIESVHNSIREGDTISEPLRRSGVFDDLVVNMIQVGEETGELDRMLIKVADTYDGEVDTLVGAMMSLLEPILIIGMGGAVGFIVIALFMPLIHLMSNMNGGR